MFQWAQQSIKNILDDISNYQLAYVTHEDICDCFCEQTLLAVQAPSGTQLEVPVPEVGSDGRKRYQIHLKSDSGQIFVLLVNKDAADSNPVAVQVPPPKDIADAISHEVELANVTSASSSPPGAHYADSVATVVPTPAGAVKRTQPAANTGHHPPHKIFKQEDLKDFDFGAEEDEEEEEGGVRSSERDSSSIDMDSLQPGPQDFTMPSMGTEIPGLDELMASESKWRRFNSLNIYLALSSSTVGKDNKLKCKTV